MNTGNMRFCSTLGVIALLLGLLLGCHRTEPRHIKLVMKRYAFVPAEVHVKQGETVELDVTTADVQHGLEIPDLGVREPIQPRFSARIRITPQRKGEFPMVCSIICGPGHDDMQGKLVVE